MLRNFGIGAKGLRSNTRRSDLELLCALFAGARCVFHQSEGSLAVLMAMTG